MKTLKEIRDELTQNEYKVKQLSVSDFDGDVKKMERYETKQANRREFLRTCIRYLESEPRADFVISECEKMNRRKQMIVNGFVDWKKQQVASSKEDSELKTQYYTQMNMKDINLQLKTLNYLLS